ncbi:MAG: dethiobiotin synthase [Gammaproteobacteria bacterium]
MNVFVAGTDTEIGKTTIVCGLLNALADRGWRVAGMKPIATGVTGDGQNADACALQEHSHPGLRYEWINPCLFNAPTAPSIAAMIERRSIDWMAIDAAYQRLSNTVDVVLVEGIGGWRVPLSDDLLASDIPRRLALPVILVAGIKLGAINHTLLTVDGIHHDQCVLSGWIANVLDPDYSYTQAAIQDLKQRISAPCLAEVPYLVTPTPIAAQAWLTAAASVVDDKLIDNANNDPIRRVRDFNHFE